MLTTNALLRIAKITVVGALALMAIIIVVGNTTDYYTNYLFVEHVLKMDTIFAGSNVHYRQIHNTALFHIFYIGIILLEAAMAYCCTMGSLKLARHFKSEATVFHAAKNWSIAGITIGLLIWFVGFEVIGGEWFAMWQSSSWNGLAAAERITGFLMAALILLSIKEGD